jgi:hypothetical protein
MLQATWRRGREVLDVVEGPDEGGDPTPSRAQVAESIESVEIFYPIELPLLVVHSRASTRACRWSPIATYPSPVAYVCGICGLPRVRHELAQQLDRSGQAS